MNIAVGSKNPIKIQAVKEAFEKVFEGQIIDVHGVEVPSGVSNQPMSDKEAIKGARNRAKEALRQQPAYYAVGLEGGLQEIEGKWFDCGWVVIVNAVSEEGIGSTVRIETGKNLMDIIHSGKELAVANDIIFGKQNSKHDQGHFGLMTNNAINRIQGYRDGVIAALSFFLHPEVFQ